MKKVKIWGKAKTQVTAEFDELSKGNKIKEGQSFTWRRVRKKRAAAYCRVSTKHEKVSCEMQRLYYKKKIEEDMTLELVDIYGDYGKSGVSGGEPAANIVVQKGGSYFY